MNGLRGHRVILTEAPGRVQSQVSELAKELDGVVKSFRERPLTGPYKYVWLDALFVKRRENGRIVNVACLVAVGVNADGRREILGLDVVADEDGADWLAFLRSLRARGLKGVELVISDAHPGLKDARTVEQLQPRFAAAAKMRADAEEIVAFTAFPKEHWERLNRETRRRTDVVGIFPTGPRNARRLSKRRHW